MHHHCLELIEKLPGFFSDESDGRIIYEFIVLRAKSYAFSTEDEEKKRQRGIKDMWLKSYEP